MKKVFLVFGINLLGFSIYAGIAFSKNPYSRENSPNMSDPGKRKLLQRSYSNNKPSKIKKQSTNDKIDTKKIAEITLVGKNNKLNMNQDENGYTELHEAVIKENIKLILNLIHKENCKYMINLCDNNGNNPLHLALSQTPLNLEVIEILLSVEIDIYKKNDFGEDCLRLIEKHYNAYCLRKSAKLIDETEEKVNPWFWARIKSNLCKLMKKEDLIYYPEKLSK